MRRARVNGRDESRRRTLPEMVERAEIGGDRHDGHEEGKEDEFVEDGAVVCISGRSRMHVLTAARSSPSCLY